MNKNTKSNYAKNITTDNLVERLFASSDLERNWRMMEAIYGAELAKKFKKLIPGDPSYMYDLALFDCMNNGKTEHEAILTIAGYSQKDWLEVIDLFKDIQEKVNKPPYPTFIK